MKHFIYFSSKAPTSGKFDTRDLMSAGRLDIAIHSLIQGVFLSHDFRKDVKFHFIFYGMPDPPKHIEIQVVPDLQINKRNLADLIKKILYKSKGEGKQEIFPECFVEKKSFLKVIDELSEEGNEIFILDKHGESLREVEIPENCAFILGDQEGLPKKEFKRLKQIATSVSVGPKMYFASQVVAIVNNELDVRGI